MSFITRVIPVCTDGVIDTTLDIYGSDMDPSRLTIMGTDGIEIPCTFNPATSIYIKATRNAPIPPGSHGFPNAEYWVAFKPYISAIFRAIIVCPLPNLSGFYKLDPSRPVGHDSYLSAENKIPDPTVHIALLGD